MFLLCVQTYRGIKGVRGSGLRIQGSGIGNRGLVLGVKDEGLGFRGLCKSLEYGVWGMGFASWAWT